MDVHNAELAAVGVKLAQFPTDGLPEIAVAGRSNVGKSTLINALINRKSLARTSSQPGKTRTINFYRVEGALYLVDLPGYGYAKAPRAETASWGRMIETYLSKRETLAGVVQLVDIRHEPTANDKQMLNWLRHYDFPRLIVATKADKLNRSQLPKQLAVIRKGLQLAKDEPLLAFSGASKAGKDEVWAALEQWLPQPEAEEE